LLTAPILIRPDYDRDFILQGDWSETAQQDNEGREHAVAYWSHCLNCNSVELKYSATEGEAMAAVKAIQQFTPYLQSHRIQL
jgi:hypothetical protein